jgi:hypothetical protein
MRRTLIASVLLLFSMTPALAEETAKPAPAATTTGKPPATEGEKKL